MFNLVLIVLGLVTLVTYLVPWIVIVAMISIIGIPIAFGLMAAPGIFLFLLLAKLIHKPISGHALSPIAAAAGALALLAGIPYPYNVAMDRRMDELVACDVERFNEPLRVKTFAMRSESRFGSGNEPQCDDLCQRMLLNDQAQRVVYATVKTIDAPLDPSAPAMSFRLERRADCPAPSLTAGSGAVHIEGEQRAYRDKTATELLHLVIAAGNCLVGEKTTLGDADAIVTRGSLQRGETPMRAGFTLGADTIRADRLALHVRGPQGVVEVLRRTAVMAEKLTPILFASLNMSGMDVRPGFFRIADYRNSASNRYEDREWSVFLSKTLGLDLALRPGDAVVETRGLIVAALDRPGPLNAAQQKLIDDYFAGLGKSNSFDPSEDALALRLLNDERAPLAQGVWAAVRNARDRPPAYFASIAGAAFRRLRAVDMSAKNGSEQAQRAATLIDALPPDAVRTHRADLEWLAREEKLSVQAWTALRQLAAFGADAAPTLLYLIDDSARIRGADVKRSRNTNDWQHPYLAGIGAFCRMGRSGGAMAQPLIERLDAGAVLVYGSYWRQTIATFVSLGADPEDLWPHMQSAEKNYNRERFDKDVERSRKKVDCSY